MLAAVVVVVVVVAMMMIQTFDQKEKSLQVMVAAVVQTFDSMVDW